MKVNRRVYGAHFVVVLCSVVFFGCASVKEGTKCALGISTKVLDDNRAGALAKEFDHDQQAAYAKSVEALSAMSSYVYHQDPPRMIALYVSGADTTPVGIYFTFVSAARTQVQIASPSTFAKEYIAKRLFARLAGLVDPLEEKKVLKQEEAKEVKSVQVIPQQEPTKRLEKIE